MMNEREKELIEELVSEFRKSLIAKFESTKAVVINSRGADVTFQTYASCIADYFCIDKTLMLSRETRLSEVKTARQILWWLCRTGESNIPYSLTKIGQLSGGFDHATIRHGKIKISNDLDYDFQTKIDVTSICKLLGFELEKVGMKYTTKNIIHEEMFG